MTNLNMLFNALKPHTLENAHKGLKIGNFRNVGLTYVGCCQLREEKCHCLKNSIPKMI